MWRWDVVKWHLYHIHDSLKGQEWEQRLRRPRALCTSYQVLLLLFWVESHCVDQTAFWPWIHKDPFICWDQRPVLPHDTSKDCFQWIETDVLLAGLALHWEVLAYQVGIYLKLDNVFIVGTSVLLPKLYL